MNRAWIILLVLMMSSTGFGQDFKKSTIDVFYKNKKPSQKVLREINKVVGKYEKIYTVSYYLITDPSNSEIISKYGLPSTHFPVAVVINGKFTAKIDGKIVSFVDFPQFMKGIGRHEGNWSISYLEAVLKDNSLLSDKNILPALKEENEHGECEETE
ncbi:MAG: hypothetical protein JXM70_03315 [Pirellulales bacterium]|nr:hypothetical protein [Pirellulales bacterium]